jgi:hypothetical protein
MERFVKEAFYLAVGVKFHTQGCKETPQHLGGVFGPPKLAIACQSLLFGKTFEMENISGPRFPIEIYTICQNLSLNDYRK